MNTYTFPKSHRQIVYLYTQNYHQIIRSALKPDLLTETLLNLRRQMAYDWVPGLELAFLQRLFAEVQVIKNRELELSWFQPLQQRITPILRRPKFLQKPLPQRAHKIFQEQLNKFQQGAILQEVLERSNFRDSDFRYRTDFKDGKICIFGASLPTWDSLASLTHELGHAFVETLRPKNDLRRQIISEAFAQIFEELFIEAILTQSEWQREWSDFQKRIDYLNFHFFEWEVSQTKWFGSPKTLPFDSASLLLRETLFTTFGYQAIYAAASLIRYRLRVKERLCIFSLT
ncbi:hypothetical protein LC608_31350 [Nostoc sp. XA010]|uniref:hypothetical protein n=1 Tax=Nostoc sp. XA010 TaxID=2780407 RepID=UPI001E28F1F4|nr:hypothetical protein [Nostoc sp. XA010]MCC5661372.1 hypothetical protein [Nostoc sp. XA010]